MKRILVFAVAMLWTLAAPQTLGAWNATGHQLVARIAWDNMTPATRASAIALMRAAPQDACLLELFPNDSRPLDVRQRELFMLASTWPDIVRPAEQDARPCTRFHRRDWHFINYFWKGISGATAADRPLDLPNIKVPELNAVERLKFLRPFVVCAAPQCGTPQDERATMLAWMLHVVGDIHQPLHSSARVTTRPDELQGDQGGNLFKLDASATPLSLHGYWDGIIDRAIPRQPTETTPAYLDRVAGQIVASHSKASLASRLSPGDVEQWSREGLDAAKKDVYPASLKRKQMPSATYRARALAIAEEAIALGGYRLADLLDNMFKL